MMNKRFIAGIGLILSGGLIAAVSAFVFHFYYLFPNSDYWFSIRHNYFDHLEFHTDQWSYFPEDTIDIFLSGTRDDSVQIHLWEIHGRDTLFSNQKFPANFQKLTNGSAVNGVGWERSAFLSIPSDASTGWYVLAIENNQFTRYSSIFIKPKPNQIRKRIAFLFSTNTWNAYNPWGGQSLYSRNYTPIVSFLRPQPLSDPFILNTYENHQLFYQAANKDKYLADFLMKNGLEYDAYSMEDLNRSAEELLHYDVLLLSTHSEYWSWSMLHHLNTCLDSGASLIALSGNTCAYVSTLEPDERTLTVYKRKGHLWLDADTNQIRPFGTEFSYSAFHSYAPYEVMADTCWAWEGIDLKKGELFGSRSYTYDYTSMNSSWWENLLHLRKKGQLGAASGLEVDKVYAHTPKNWILLASGKNIADISTGEVYPESGNWESKAGADMGYYLHPGGGIVFSGGSMALTGAIPLDTTIQKLILNVFEKALNN